jgi:hypothetical protein
MTATVIQQVTDAPESAGFGQASEQLGVLRELLTGGEILPSQLPSPSHWSPALRLSTAVMAQAMADLRLRRRDGRDHIQVSSALRWVRSNDSDWPLSFLRVCELLQLDPSWVRGIVKRWLRDEAPTGRNSSFRHAA